MDWSLEVFESRWSDTHRSLGVHLKNFQMIQTSLVCKTGSHLMAGFLAIFWRLTSGPDQTMTHYLAFKNREKLTGTSPRKVWVGSRGKGLCDIVSFMGCSRVSKPAHSASFCTSSQQLWQRARFPRCTWHEECTILSLMQALSQIAMRLD